MYKNVLTTLSALCMLMFAGAFNADAMASYTLSASVAGTLDFNTSDGALGTIITDGMGGTTDIPDIQYQIYSANADSTANGITWGYYGDVGLGVDGIVGDLGGGDPFFAGDPMVIIKSADGTEFSLEGIMTANRDGIHTRVTFEGFRNNVSTGSVTLDVDYMVTGINNFTTADLTPAIFQYVDEIRITNPDIPSDAPAEVVTLAFDNIVFGDPVSPDPTVTDPYISISGASGTGGAYKIGDTISATWNNTGTGDNNAGITGVTADFSQFGGGAAVTATNSASSWTATYTITVGAIDATSRNVSITASNANGPTTTADTSNATVDNVAPTVTDARISISGGTGSGGTYIVGDTVTATWNNTIGGDNNSDTISGVTVDFFQFGGGAAVAATNSSSTWTATYTIVAGAIEAGDRNISVTATDNAGNTTTRADTSNAGVDNAAPVVASVSVPANGTYVVGQNLDFVVNIASASDVVVDTSGGTPRIALTVGASTRYASYISGSASPWLSFRYTVQPGDFDANGIAVAGAIDANGGSLQDGSGNNMTLTLNSVDSTAAVLIDGLTVPDAPTIGTATAGDGQANVSFTAPVNNGGSAITTYTATASPGGATGNCAGPTACSINVNGLDNGTSYSFTVTATNIKGNSAASAASNAVIPKANQTITFNNPGAQNFGSTPTLTATSSAGIGYTVSFASATTGVCTITSGGALTFVTAGTCTIDADQPGDATTNAAATVSRSFSINSIAPDAPTIGSATAGDSEASVAFTAPINTGGANITGYTVTSSPGGFTGTGAGSPISVTGLTNGVAYTFTVTATNSAGTGAASAASNTVTPAAPQTITFNNPGAQNFGTTPTLTATSSAGAGYSVTFTSSTTGVCTITSGGTLTFVTAGTCTINADQAGDSSFQPASQVSRSFTVNPVAPAAPTIGTAIAGDTQASVAFVAPMNSGGSAVTGYTVTTNPADVAPILGASSPIVVNGLTNGQGYTFTVTANNAAGIGPASSASNAVTPAAIQTITFANPGAQNFGTSPALTATSDSGLTPNFNSSTTAVCTITSAGALTFVSAGSCTVNANQPGNASYLPATQVSHTFTVNAVLPGAPVIGTATAGNGQAAVNFTAPAFNGGAAISSYTVTSSPGNISASGAGAPLTVAGLTNGTAYTFTVTATNSAGTSAASAASNSVTPEQPNRAPTIAGVALAKVLRGTAYSFVPTANDADEDTLSFSIVNKPVWATFDTATGALTGTPAKEHVGTTSGIVISVSDGEANAALAAFSIEVSAVNAAPTITGTPATSVNQDEAYSFTPTATDADEDTLTFSIVNKPLWAAFDTTTGALTGTPAKDDVGSTSGIVISVSDGELSAALPAFNLQVINVNEAPEAIDDNLTLPFSISNVYQLYVLANDTDPDGDSLSITFATASIGSVTIADNQLRFSAPDNFSGTASLNYSISDGEFNASANVTLQIDGTNPDAPVITVPDDLTVNATGLFTKVNVGVAVALDRNGNRLPVVLDKNTLVFSPGEHLLYWSATDSDGVSSTTTQLLRVLPLISISKAQTVANYSAVTVDVVLNGPSPVYPVDVSYSVSGSAGAGDHDLVADTVSIASGVRAGISFNVYADLTSNAAKDLLITLDNGPNLAANASTTVTITDGNVLPEVNLAVMQQGTATSLVSPDGGPVTVIATVTDANVADTHSFDWQLPGSIAFSEDGAAINFDPADLSGGYEVRVTVTDSADFWVQARVYFRVIAALPVLDANSDTDSDGISDALEGIGDNDGNGIPDYLDNMPSPNILPQQINTTSSYLVECDPGVRCGLGLFALSGSSGGVQILNDELDLLNDLTTDQAFESVGGIYDFVIRDLPTPGQSVRIVLPQRAAIPTDAVYRKFQRGNWISFVSDANNVLHSAAGNPGYCPPPGAADWQPGLTAGHWCVQLTIEDGGPNDDDGLVNAAVVDPGGVSMPRTDNAKPVASNDSYNQQWNQTQQLTVLDNDTDADGDNLTISQVSAAFGDVTISDDGLSLWYTPAQDFIGTDTLSYTIIDGNNGSGSATVNVTLYYNQAPTISNSSASTDDMTAINIDVLSDASDADGDTLSIASASAQTGSVSITSEQQLRYTPKAGFSGTDVITFSVSDNRGGVTSASVSISVTLKPRPVEPPPAKSSGGSMHGLLLLLSALLVIRRKYRAV